MKKNLIAAYAVLACLICLLFLVVSGALSLYFAVRAAAPSVTLDRYTYYSTLSDENFLATLSEKQRPADPSALRARRIAARDQALNIERHEGTSALLNAFAFTLAAGLAFWLHWRLGLREHGSAAGTAVSMSMS